MSLFLESRAQLPLRAPTLVSDWCRTTPLLAIAAEGGHVWLVNEQGERVDSIDLGSAQFNYETVALAWHPTKPILALGRSDGCVSVWVEGDHTKNDDASQHKAAIALLQWAPEGARLISADKSGRITVWVSSSSGFTVGCHYQRNDELTHCIFRTLPDSEAKGGASFLVGGRTGMIGHANDSTACLDAFTVEAPVASMNYHEGNDEIVVLTKNNMLWKWKCVDGDTWEQNMKVKLSVAIDGSISSACWAGGGVLVVVTGEPLLRVYDLTEGENYVLQLDMSAQGASNHGDRAISCSFNNRSGRLAAGTRDGRIFIWQYAPAIFDSAGAGADNWEALPGVKLESGVRALQWSAACPSLGVTTVEGASVLNESVMSSTCVGGLACLQAAADWLLVQTIPNGTAEVVVPQMSVKGVSTNGKQTVMWDGKQVQVFETGPEGREAVLEKVHSFAAAAILLVAGVEGFFMVERSEPQIIKGCNWAGTTKNQLTFLEQHGPVCQMDINNGFLVAATKSGKLQLWNVGRREPKALGAIFEFEREKILWERIGGAGEAPPPTSTDTPKGEIVSVRVNNAAQRISIIASMKLSNGLHVPDTRLYVFDVENDKWSCFDFGMRCPSTHWWDSDEPRLLAVQTGLAANARKEAMLEGLSVDEREEVSVFVSTKDHSIVLQDSFMLEDKTSELVGIGVPYIHYVCRMPTESVPAGCTRGTQPKLCHQVMRDFRGMEGIDAESRTAVLDFSFYLTIGEMDAAYQAVKQITCKAVWENMAHMCIKTKRLDVAEICIGQMGDARTAQALRLSKQETELDARVGILALQLGMYSDAARLFKECKRYDLLSELMQAQGSWDDAIELVEKHERIALRTVHFNHAKYLESTGEIEEAIEAYELAKAHSHEVPRMLHSRGMIQQLEQYIKRSDDFDLHTWWGQYCESKSDFASALEAYGRAENHLAKVRILCFQAEFPTALQLCEDTNDMAATYHLAKQLEAAGELRDAVQLYARTGSASHAIRVARRCGEADGELMGLASSATHPKAMIEAAAYFEEHQQYEKAVQLYSRAGDTARALQLCFDAQLFSSLSSLVENMDSNSTSMSPQLLSRCASFFLEHQQFDKAVMLYIKSGEITLGMDLCLQHNIVVTEEMAEHMTLDKDDSGTEQAEQHNRKRLELLFKLAKCCKLQGQYHLACKKYTQAGDKVKAMKALIKSGDTDKINFFANVSRHRDIYVMAANYLQTLDWHNDQAIMKNIIQYYTKAKELNSLSGFYEACSQVEIDEYRDYEKAFSALKEALKYMIKARVPDKEERLAALQQRIFLVEKFVHARKLVKSDPEQMIKICQQLLHQSDLEQGIRVGDVFALMIEYSHAQADMSQAYLLIEQMRTRNIILSPYLDREMIESIYRAVGMEPVFEEAEEDDGMEEDIVTED